MSARAMTLHEILAEKEKTFVFGPFQSIMDLRIKEAQKVLPKELISSSVMKLKVELLENRVSILLDKLEEISKRIRQLEEAEEKIIVIKEVPRKEAKDKIKKLFETGDILDYGIIAEKLQLSLPFVVDICNELEEEGEIGEPR